MSSSGQWYDVPDAVDLANIEWSEIQDKPSFASVAYDGLYSSLTGQPTYNDTSGIVSVTGLSINSIASMSASGDTLEIDASMTYFPRNVYMDGELTMDGSMSALDIACVSASFRYLSASGLHMQGDVSGTVNCLGSLTSPDISGAYITGGDIVASSGLVVGGSGIIMGADAMVVSNKLHHLSVVGTALSATSAQMILQRISGTHPAAICMPSVSSSGTDYGAIQFHDDSGLILSSTVGLDSIVTIDGDLVCNELYQNGTALSTSLATHNYHTEFFSWQTCNFDSSAASNGFGGNATITPQTGRYTRSLDGTSAWTYAVDASSRGYWTMDSSAHAGLWEIEGTQHIFKTDNGVNGAWLYINKGTTPEWVMATDASNISNYDQCILDGQNCVTGVLINPRSTGGSTPPFRRITECTYGTQISIQTAFANSNIDYNEWGYSGSLRFTRLGDSSSFNWTFTSVF